MINFLVALIAAAVVFNRVLQSNCILMHIVKYRKSLP